MTIALIIAALLAFHLLGGAVNHRRHRRSGLRPNIYWSLGRGWYGSIRLPGGFRLGHRIGR